MKYRSPLAILLLLSASHFVRAEPVVVSPPVRADALVKLAKQIEPDLEGRAERLPAYIEYFRSQLGNDRRLFLFDVQAVSTGAKGVELKGCLEFPQTRAGLVGFLGVLGFDVNDEQLEMLPEGGLGKKAFGLVKTSHTLSYDRPAEPRSVVTDCLLGERLYLLREVGDHLLVHSDDGYLGYVAAADVHRVDAAAFGRYPTDSSVRMTDDHLLGTGITIPAGACLKLLSEEDGKVECALPDGKVVEIPRAVCRPTTVPEVEIECVISSGKRLLGVPYHWGGKTSEGVDCSGLVQVAFASVGVHIPRDSDQQFQLGQLSATRWHRADLRKGDTLYFLGTYGRIRHTALYLGDGRYLQAEMPAVNIRSLNPEHEDYDPRRAASFAFAKRLW